MDKFIIRKVIQKSILYFSAVIVVSMSLIIISATAVDVIRAIDLIDHRYADSQFIVALISGFAAIIASIIYKRYNNVRVPKIDDNSKKFKIYELLINDIVLLIKMDQTILTRKNFENLIDEHLAAVILVSSRSVVNHFFYLRDYAKKDADTLELLFICEYMINAIREDMGYKEEIISGRLLSLYRLEHEKELCDQRERLRGKPFWSI